MFNLPDKYVEIDGFRIPADKADEYKKYRSDICEDNAMYLIKANAPINTEAHSITQTWLNANKIQFLIDERVAK